VICQLFTVVGPSRWLSRVSPGQRSVWAKIWAESIYIKWGVESVETKFNRSGPKAKPIQFRLKVELIQPRQ